MKTQQDKCLQWLKQLTYFQYKSYAKVLGYKQHFRSCDIQQKSRGEEQENYYIWVKVCTYLNCDVNRRGLISGQESVFHIVH